MMTPCIEDFRRVRTTQEICGSANIKIVETEQFQDRSQGELSNASLFILQFDDTCMRALCVKSNYERGPSGDTVFSKWLADMVLSHFPPPVVFAYTHIDHSDENRISTFRWTLNEMYRTKIGDYTSPRKDL
jgi:hypothetical protein